MCGGGILSCMNHNKDRHLNILMILTLKNYSKLYINNNCKLPLHIIIYINKIYITTYAKYYIIYNRGPLFICLTLSILLSLKAPTKQTSHVFTTVFIVMWIGSLIVTINAQLLGASISIFQSLCVLGYCVSP
jgi:hypothetical protein